MDLNLRGIVELDVWMEYESDSDESDYLNNYDDDMEIVYKKLD